MGAALMSFGARDSKQKAREKNKVKDYDVIMDEEIEFVQALQMPGSISDKVHTHRQLLLILPKYFHPENAVCFICLLHIVRYISD